MVIHVIDLITYLVCVCTAVAGEWISVYVPHTPNRDITNVNTFRLGEKSSILDNYQ